jgi:aspartate aminotransferase
LYSLWKEELFAVTQRIAKMREALYNELKALETPGSWEHVVASVLGISYFSLANPLEKQRFFIGKSFQNPRGTKCLHGFE